MAKYNDLTYYWDYLEEILGVSEDCLSCMTNINGYTYETLCDVLYWKTGYHDLDDYIAGLYNSHLCSVSGYDTISV